MGSRAQTEGVVICSQTAYIFRILALFSHEVIQRVGTVLYVY